MPETPKSFEEVDAHLTRIFEMQNLVESPDGTRITLGQFIRNKLAEKDAEIARLRATLPPQAAVELERETDGRWIAEVPSVPGAMAYGATPTEAAQKAQGIAQTAVGEGELPEVRGIRPERLKAILNWHEPKYSTGVHVSNVEAESLVIELREAIAQRDEAIRTRDSFYGSLKLAVVRAEAAEAKLAEIKRQIDGLDRSVDPDTGEDTTLERVQYLVGEMIAGNYAIPDRAALDIPKPEEIERPPCPECGAPMGWKLACVCGFPEQPPLGDKEIESLRKLLLIRNPKIMELREIAFQAEKLLARYHLAALRLRSLPSESEEIEKLYFIQDTRTTCGNAVMWWKPDGNGYTSNVNEAWRVPKEKADQMHRNRSTDVAWPVSVILGKAFPIFDFQNLRSIEKDK